jgi:HEAT repeat protein
VLGCYQNHPPDYRLFFGVNAALLLAGLFLPAPVAFGSSVLALVLLVCAWAAWGENEARRGRIAKKIEDIPSPPPAELAWVALLTMGMVLLHLPPFLQAGHACFDAFETTGGPTVLDWGRFLLDKTYLRALPDSVDLWITKLEGLHGKSIDYRKGPAGYVGVGLVMAAWGLVAITVVQGVARWWQGRRDMLEGTEGVKRDPDMAVRLGRRAVPSLLVLWDSPELQYQGNPEGHENDDIARARCNIVEALGRIGDASALALLKKAARDRRPDVQRACLRSMGMLANSAEMADHRAEVVGILDEALHKGPSENARRGAAAGLAELDDPSAAGPLLAKLEQVYRMEPPSGQEESRYTEEPNVRKDVIVAVGLHFARRRGRGEEEARLAKEVERAVYNILAHDETPSLLEDVYLRVRNAAAGALARLGDRRAVMPLVERLQDSQYQNPQLVADTVTALGELVKDLLGRPAEGRQEEHAGVVELARQLHESPNDSVRRAAVRALADAVSALPENAQLADEALETLLKEHQNALIDGHWELANLIQEEALRAARARPQEKDSKVKPRLKSGREKYGLQASQERRAALLRASGRQDGKGLEKRVAAARQIGEARDARGLGALQRALARKWEDTRLAEACAWALGEVLSALRVLAEDETEPDRRRARAVYELGRFGRSEERRVLAAVRNGARSGELRKTAEDALTRLEKRLGGP